jgi:nucleotide-binding universal stress UspA family protein
MYERILVPLDGSRRAEAIMPHLKTLAHCFGAKVIILQVVEPAYIPSDPASYLPELESELNEHRKREAENYLHSWKQRLGSQEIEAEVKVEMGPVVETIIKVSQDENVDLIAMASHGRSGFSRVIYGSVANGVLQKIDRPILLIRSIEKD